MQRTLAEAPQRFKCDPGYFLATRETLVFPAHRCDLERTFANQSAGDSLQTSRSSHVERVAKRIGIDTTTLGLVRECARSCGATRARVATSFLPGLASTSGREMPTSEDLVRRDRTRKKHTSNKE